MTYSARKLVAISVFVVMLSSFVVLSGIFFQMYLAGETAATIQTNAFGEHRLELAILAGAHVFMPVLLYELTETV